MEPILQILNDLNIPYELQEHKAIFSEEDSKDVVITLEGTDVKNLFVKDKNNNYGLVSLDLQLKNNVFYCIIILIAIKLTEIKLI